MNYLDTAEVLVLESRKCIDVNGILELDDEDFIQQLYSLLLNRKADKEGQDFYLDALKSGMSRSSLVLSIASSREAVDKRVAAVGIKNIPMDSLMGYNGALFVDNVYLMLLSRHMDQSGIESYLIPYTNGQLSKIEIIYDIRYSSEGEEHNTIVEGLADVYKSYLHKRWIFQMPIVGKIVKRISKIRKIINNVNIINNNIYELQLILAENESKTRQEKLRARIENIEKDSLITYSKISDKIEDLEKDSLITYSKISDRIEDLEKDSLITYSKISDRIEDLEKESFITYSKNMPENVLKTFRTLRSK